MAFRQLSVADQSRRAAMERYRPPISPTIEDSSRQTTCLPVNDSTIRKKWKESFAWRAKHKEIPLSLTINFFR